MFAIGAAPPALTVVSGPVVSEARQSYANWGSATTRLWAGADEFEFEATLGPIPTDDDLGKEIIVRYETDLDSSGTWWTDSNGRNSITRVYNHRASFNLTVEEPEAGNYYPASGFIYTCDAATGVTLSVLPDRAQGGASLADGALELMLHRRLLKDDALGVGEALNETGLDASGEGLVVRTRHTVQLGASPDASAVARRGALADATWRHLARFAPLPNGTSPAAWAAARRTNFSGLAAPLPPSLHLLTAHALGPSQLLLRIAHEFDAGEGGAAAGDVSIDLAAIFAPGVLVLGACVETTVTGNQPLADAPRTTYAVEGGPTVTLPVVPLPPAGPGQTVTLSALQIRTFLCDASFPGGQPLLRALPSWE